MGEFYCSKTPKNKLTIVSQRCNEHSGNNASHKHLFIEICMCRQRE